MEECFFWYLSYFITRVRYFIKTSLTIGSALLNILRRYEMKNTCREHVKIVFSLDAFAEYWSIEANEGTLECQSRTYKEWLRIL